MTQHLEPSRRRRPAGLASRKIRALLCLGIFAAPVVTSTMAYWTDEATLTSGSIAVGTLDLTVGPTLEDSDRLIGTGGMTPYSALTIADLVPGESIARPFVVRNYGTTSFVYNGSVSTVDNDLVSAGSGLTAAVYSGGTPTNTGTDGAGNRVGVCASGALLKDQTISTSTIAVNVSPVDLMLSPGTTQTFCVKILLHPATPNALQGQITQVVVRLDAKQVGAP